MAERPELRAGTRDCHLIHGTYEEGYGLEKNMHIPKHRESRTVVLVQLLQAEIPTIDSDTLPQTFMVRPAE